MYQLPSGGETALPIDNHRENEFTKTWDAIRRRWRACLAIFVIFFGLALLYALFFPKSYTATTQLITGNSSSNFSGVNTDLPVLNALVAAGGVQSVETYATMIQTKGIAAQVIKDLHLHTDVYNLLKYDISVLPVTNTQIVTLNATWKDPKTAAAIANDFAKVTADKQRDLIAGQSVEAMTYLSQQMPKAETEMHRSDTALAAFEATHNIADINAQTASTVGQYSDISASMAKLEVDESQAQATLGSVVSQIAANSKAINGGTNIAQNPVLSQLQQQLAQVDVQLAAAKKQYTEQHPTVQALEQQQSQLQKEMTSQPTTYVASNSVVPNPLYQQLEQQAAQLRSQAAGDESQIATLRQQEQAMGSKVRDLPAVAQRLASLQRDAQLADNVYNTIKQRYNDALVAKTLALSNISVMQRAEARFATVKPSLTLTIGLGLVLGVILALSGGFAIDFFDNSLKDENDVQRVLSLPVLASVPQLTSSGRKQQGRLPLLRALTIEAYLQLVTSLRYATDKPLRTLTVTSALQGDGKSTVALNTAIAMAEIRPRVLLVDADMRRPTLHEKLDLPLGPGLTNVLVGEKDSADVIIATRYPGLDILMSGMQPPNPVKLIQSPRFSSMVDKLLDRYDVVVFDTPAALPMVDAAALGAKTDGTVLVVSAGKTDTRSASRALQRLTSVEGVNVLGVVLNRAAPNSRDSAYFLQTSYSLPPSGDLEPV